MNKEMKPCPFCGGKAVLLKTSKYECFIQCNRKCVEQTRLYKTEGSAIKAWNRRKESIVHGHWEEKEVIYDDNDNGVITEWQSCRCSECKKYDTSPYLYYFKEPKYCSECGAKMDEVTG